MRLRVGLAVSSERVRAVAVRDGKIVWGGESTANGQSIEAAVAELFGAARLRRWPRPVVVAAVGPARAQLRRLAGLPPVADVGALSRLVGEGASRFFLRNGIPLVTTGVRREADGEGWGAAIEEPVVVALDAACRKHGLRLAAVLPTMAVIPLALQGDELTWHDGEIHARVTLLEGRLGATRRMIAEAAPRSEDDELPVAVAALAALGAEGWRFADAYGAAVSSPRETLAYRPTRTARSRQVPAWRARVAGLALLIATASAFLVPPLVARRRAAHAVSTLSRLARARDAAVAAESDLARVSGALREVAAFDRDRRSMSHFVSDIAHALPNGSALVTLRADSAGGVLVALAPRAALLIGRLEEVPDFSTPTIVGPVTREVAGGAEVERLTVRFRWAGVAAMATIPRVVR